MAPCSTRVLRPRPPPRASESRWGAAVGAERSRSHPHRKIPPAPPKRNAPSRLSPRKKRRLRAASTPAEGSGAASTAGEALGALLRPPDGEVALPGVGTGIDEASAVRLQRAQMQEAGVSSNAEHLEPRGNEPSGLESPCADPPTAESLVVPSQTVHSPQVDGGIMVGDAWRPGEEPKPGTIFEGDGGRKWVYESLLGIGGMARVYAVADESGKQAALKMRWPQRNTKKDNPTVAALAQIKLELINYKRLLTPRNGASLDILPRLLQPTPHALPLSPAYMGENTYFFVMERLGRSLDSLERPVPVAHLSVIGKQLIEGLKELHSLGFVHHDLNPENVCWARASGGEDDTTKIRIIDLGLVKPIRGRGMVGCQEGKPDFVGSRYFSGETYSFRDDLEAVGFILAHLHGVNLPWAGLYPINRHPKPGELQKVLDLRQRDPAEYLKGSIVADAIASFLRAVRQLDGQNASAIDYDALSQQLDPLDNAR